MTSSWSRLNILLVVLSAFLLRVMWLDHQELRGDEVFGYFFSLQPSGEIVANTLALAEPHPVASYLVEHMWLGVGGGSEFALRFLSAWFGTLAVAILYRLARRLALSTAAATVAAVLLAVSPYAIWHSQDARMYSMSLALTLLSMWLALEWLARGGWRWATAYVAVTLLALHTHYFTVFILLAQNLYVVLRLLWTERERLRLVKWLALQAVVFLLYLPWLVMAQELLVTYRGNGDSPDFAAMVMRSFSVLAVGEAVPSNMRVWWALAAVALITLSSVLYMSAGKGRGGRLLVVLLYLLIPLMATWLSSRARPIYNERYLVAAGPPFFLLCAAFLDNAIPWLGHTQNEKSDWSMKRRTLPWLRTVAVGLLCLVVIGMVAGLRNHYVEAAYSKTRGWRDLAETLGRYAAGMADGSVVFAQNFPDPTLWYYYTGAVEHIVLPPDAHDAEGTRREVEKLSDRGVRRVILPVQPEANWDDRDLASTALAAKYRMIGGERVGVWPVYVYDLPVAEMTPMATVFENGIALTGYGVTADRPVPGGILNVTLRWQGEEELRGTEKVFVHLVDEEGVLVAQDDRMLASSLGEQMQTGRLGTYGILLPSPMKNGEYRLIAGLYDPGIDGAPRIAITNGADSVFLKSVFVDSFR